MRTDKKVSPFFSFFFFGGGGGGKEGVISGFLETLSDV